MASNKSKFNPNAITGNLSNKVATLEAKDEFNFRFINIDDLISHRNNDYEMVDIDKLAENIKEIGLQHNLVVRAVEGNKFEIISGHRRCEALKLIGETKAPCKVIDTIDDVDAELALIHLNSEVRAESELSKARHARRLIELYNIKKQLGYDIKGRIVEHVAKDMNMSSMQVQRYNKLNELIPELQQMLESKEITMSKATHFAGMSEDDQKAVYELLKQNVEMSREEALKLKLELKKKDDEINNKNSEINNFEIALKNSSETIENLQEEKNKLIDDITRKNEEAIEIAQQIDDIKKNIRIEIEKDVSERSSKQLEDLNKKLKILEDTKGTVEGELDKLKNEIKNNEKAKKDDVDNIEKNAEIKFAMKELDKAISTFILTLTKNASFATLTEENLSHLKKISEEKVKNITDTVKKYIV